MNALVDLLNSAWAQRVGWALVHFLWQGALIAALTWLTLRLLARRIPQARYLVACLALLLMVTAPMATFLVVYPSAVPANTQAKITPIFAEGKDVAVGLRVDFGQLPVDLTRLRPGHFRVIDHKHPLTGDITDMFEVYCPSAGQVAELRFKPDFGDFGSGNTVTVSTDNSLPLKQGQGLEVPLSLTCDTDRVVGQAQPTPQSPAISRLDMAATWITPVMPYAVTIWLAGVILCSIWHLGGWLRVQRLRRAGILLAGGEQENSWLSAAKRLAERFRLQRPVRLLKVAHLAGPVVVGVFRPAVLIPAAVITGLTPPQIEAILAHELAHIRRHDYLVNLLQTLVETVLFYHPAVWWVSARIRAEREHCCDDLAVAAVGDSHSYAAALAALAEIAAANRPIHGDGILTRLAPAKRVAPGAGMSLLSRIRRVMGIPESSSSRWTGALAGLIVLTGIMFAIAIYGCKSHSPVPPAITDEETWFRGYWGHIHEQLLDRDANIRVHAVEKLGQRVNGREAIDALKLALNDPVPAVRYTAAVSLAKLGYVDDQVAVALAECFINGQASGMRNGASAFDVTMVFNQPGIASKAKAGVPLFIKAAQSGASSQWRCDAVKILGKIGAPQAVPVLREALHGSDDDLRCAAVRSLAMIGPTAKDAAPDLTNALGGQDYCARLAGEALAKIGAVDVLIDEVKKRDTNRLEPAVLGLAFATDHLEEAAKALTAEVARGNLQAAESLLALGDVAKLALPEFLELTKKQWDLAYAGRAVVGAKFAAKFGFADQFLPILIGQLRSNESWESANAAVALGEMGPAAAPAIKELLRVLKSNAPGTARQGTERNAQFSAAKALGKIKSGDPEVIPALIEAMDSPDPLVRQNAEWSLGQYGSSAKEAVPSLIKYMRRPTREEAVNGWYTDPIAALTKIGPAAKDAVPALVQDIKDYHSNDESCTLLAAIGPGAAEAVPSLFAEGVTNWDRDRAKKTIASIGAGAIPFLMEKLHGAQQEQAFAAECLAQMDSLDKSLLPTLVDLLGHNDRGIRVHASQSLAKMGAGAVSAVSPLRKLLTDPEPWVQFEAATALRKIAQATRVQATQPATAPATVYSAWPFDAKEAAKRQDETANALRVNKDGAIDLGNKVTMKLTLIPAGRFKMGTSQDMSTWPQTQIGPVQPDSEMPQHEVTISRPFYMGIYTVTEEQYEQVMGTQPGQAAPDPTWLETRRRQIGFFNGCVPGPDYPAMCISRDKAAEFCKRLSERTGRTVRLPTEAQWEYACRAGGGGRFHFGNLWDNGEKLRHCAWVLGNSNDRPHAVGQKSPNPWGLYDVYGNVFQWCSDWYAKGYGFGDPQIDPTGPAKGELGVQRGGYWGTFELGLGSAARVAEAPTNGRQEMGFRAIVELLAPATHLAPAVTQPATQPAITTAEVVKIITGSLPGFPNMSAGESSIRLYLGEVEWGSEHKPAKEDAPAFLAIMKNDKLSIPQRLAAARFLLDLDNPDARQFVIECLDGKHNEREPKPGFGPSNAEEAAYVLAFQVRPEQKWTIQQIGRVLKDDRLLKSGYQKDRSESLDWLCEALADQKIADAVPALIDILERRPACYSAAEALGKIGDKAAVPVLLKTVEAGGQFNSGQAGALAAFRDERVVPVLLRHLDKGEYVFGLLVEIKDPRTLGPVRDYVKAHPKDHHAAIALVWLEAKDNDDAARSLLNLLAGQTDHSAQNDIVWALGTTRSPLAVAAVYKLARESQEWTVVSSSIMALGRIGGREATSRLVDLLDRDYSNVEFPRKPLELTFPEEAAGCLKDLTGQDLGTDSKPWRKWLYAAATTQPATQAQ